MVSSVCDEACPRLCDLVPGLCPCLLVAGPGQCHLGAGVADHGTAQPVAHLVSNPAAGLQLTRGNLQ